MGADACEDFITINAGKIEEIKRLKKIFTKIEPKRKKLVEKLIERAAFMYASMVEMERRLEEEGLTTWMKQGESKFERAHPLLEKHIAMGKNYTTVIKQLEGLLPEQKIDATAQGRELMKFAAAARGDKK